MTTYSACDTLDSLNSEQLELLSKSQCDLLIVYLAERTHFDAHRIRLLLEMGAIEASRRLAATGESPSGKSV
ncbi:BolA family transcriptional regulator [Novimethylophilus kurashikiensis]|uniref:BolA family transcriptional regulator n=1 Tax=Novimethylophilus kurashikiensis TaxID=1825523 RepID=A0A2R5F943_9PROT|nr:BolA family transcriptional regulator [Novimethylophilus kurashikiensis]